MIKPLGGAQMETDWHPCKERKCGYTEATGMRRRGGGPCEDTTRRQHSASQVERPQESPTGRHLDLGLLVYRTVTNFHFLSLNSRCLSLPMWFFVMAA